MLDADLATGLETLDGGLAWGTAYDSQSIIYPYWRYGSAGVGTAVVRYNKVLGNNTYKQTLEKATTDLSNRGSISSGLGTGLYTNVWSAGNPRSFFRARTRLAGRFCRIS